MKALKLLFLLLLIVSCHKKKDHPYTFYYWRTNLKLDLEEKKVLDKAPVPFLYTRFFDVDKVNGTFQPVAVITRESSFKTVQKIVPTVFITNPTLLGITQEEIKFLAESIHHLIQKKSEEYHLTTNNEIQIDCDWTAGTRDDYFRFLKELKRVSGKEVTCTLRLHQVKDRKLTGIPPVDKVYLMCYSTSSPLEKSDKNSILDVNILKSYLSKLEDYPIKNIDVALPIYSWGIVTNHLDKHKLINALSKKDLENPDFKKISEYEAEITKDGFYFGRYLNKGFTIKVEEISEEQLEEVIQFLEKKIPTFNVIYYQLDSKFVSDRKF
ncbi:hypothetical protein SAMN05421692_1883 [Chryseobacterium indologenes]|uniref:hypothetical protein n=1 Tax=Chryseobacterium indologenes TaxID=253 RepID=UPI0003E0820E|nr:hypothetical protein [Chryseobacterium indologenes]GAE63911.1 hypothetical protein CIN01S_04_05190 [Chryseobacterium indologenes NBRC 14944]SFJ52843.1 hypothetical protein SAMN05421692_1883 [Chryseobacterium indologenes]SUX52447.1 Uncharacterised protein [Chryseobacterium indologenes]